MDYYRRAIGEIRSLLARAKRSPLLEPTAMSLATVRPSGQPSVRTVLLKEISAGGFVFYTNLGSRKGQDLRKEPRCALCFFWEGLHHQVLIEGRAKTVRAEEADAYWVTRPRESQLGAWASLQSEELKSRALLIARLREIRRRYAGKPVPRPPHWSGFRVMPSRIEIWKRGPARLHHRRVFIKSGSRWTFRLLYP